MTPVSLVRREFDLFCVAYFFSLFRKRRCSKNMPFLGTRKDLRFLLGYVGIVEEADPVVGVVEVVEVVRV
jgi:hypothetical protein